MLILLWLARKIWRGVPTSGHIATAHTREQIRRNAVQRQNDAADEIIREWEERKASKPEPGT
jgi:hypothetical protein